MSLQLVSVYTIICDAMRKVTVITLMVALFFSTMASAQEYRKETLFMPKGTSGAGIQISYLDLGSTDSDIMLVLKELNATGTYMSVAPFYTYTYKDNRCIGARLKYTKGTGDISKADLSLFSDDLSFSVEDIAASTRSIQMQVFQRSYLGLDSHGRFGLFNDLTLSYGNTRSSFSLNQESLNAYSLTKKVKLGVSPGIMIFILNNVSTHVSMSIGGVSYTHTDNIKDGEVVGKRDFTKAHFAPDVTDITMGITIYL